ncbi:MAG: lantibiotic dehydratase [Pyrinomonadaceae bacterium]
MDLQLIEAEIGLEQGAQQKDGLSLPEHLISLDGEQWALWRTACLRGAGFPAAHILKLVSHLSAAAADHLLKVEEEMKLARRTALEALTRDRDAAEDQRGLFDKALRRLWKGKLPEPLDGAYESAAAVEALRARCVELDSAWAEFRRTFEASLVEVSRSVHEIAQMKNFREAIAWQNRDALHGSIDGLLRMSPGSTSQRSSQRKRELLITNYLQRYCTKNDTIGFFGPVAWARFVPDGEAIAVRPGADLLATRSVYFEGWCLDVLAATLAADKALQPWLAPRRLPFVHLNGAMLHLPFENPTRLPPGLATVLHACDGQRAAREIACELVNNPSSTLKSEAEVYRLLEILHQRGVVSWTLEVPWTLEFPYEKRLEGNLRRLLERIGDEGLRQRALGALAELETARDAVADAAGDDETLDYALAQLEETFKGLTRTSPTRAAGKTYAGRTLVYEDCRRDIEVELGPEMLQALAQPLAPLLTSARWFTSEVAAIYRTAFTEIYTELAAQSGSSTVEAVNFWLRAQPLLFEDKLRLVDTLVPSFQQRWAEVLCVPTGERRVAYSSEQLRSRALAAFDAPRPGWYYARYHSPDVMIAASSVEAIRRGDYQLVLGELHIGLNSVGGLCFLAQHPSPEEPFRALELDVPEPRLVPVTPKAMVTSRNYPVFISQKDFRLEFARDPSSVSRDRALPIGALVIDNTDAGLVVRTRDGHMQFDIMDAFADVLSGLATNSFKLLRPETHTPRITFDRLVVCRETWRFTPSEISFAHEKEEAERFVSARRWARERDMPRFVFAKVPSEIKPFYVDFDSPLLIEMFAKSVRQMEEVGLAASLISITEMIPRLDQAWLPDAEGQRYTSELRIIAVDQAR